MRINYFADTEGHSGVSIYSRELMQSLERRMELNKISPKHILKPEFLNKPVFNPFILQNTDKEVLHITNQDDLAIPYVPQRKIVVTVHDLFPYVEEHSGPIYSLASKIYVRNLKKHADKIIAISEFTKEQIVENTNIKPDKIEVIYQGVSLETFQPSEKEVEYSNYYLHVGSEINRKNVAGLIDIFSKIKEREEEAVLVRVGKASDKTRKRIRQQNLELGKDVIYEENVDTERLVDLYSNAKKLLLPSHGEGFGRPIVESLACGTPVIAYDRKPMSEVLLGKMLVKEGDVDAFVTKSIAQNSPDQDCRKIAENYTWEKTAEETVEVYRKLAKH